MKQAVQVFYEGHVQGVGFRYTVRQIATGFDVAGFVCNLADGRVEMQASGDPEELDAFLKEIRESTLAGHITREIRNPLEPVPGFRGFTISS